MRSSTIGDGGVGAVRGFITGVTLSFFLGSQLLASGAAWADAPRAAAPATLVNPFARTPAGSADLSKAAVQPAAVPAPRAPAAKSTGPAPSLAATQQALSATLRQMHTALARQRDIIIKKRGKDGVLHITILGTRQDVDLGPARTRLAAIEQQLEAQDRDAELSFQQDQEHIREHHLPPLIQQRHDEALTRFERGRTERAHEIDALEHSQDLSTLLAQSEALLKQTTAAQPQYSGFDLRHVPFRVPAASVRAPLTTPGGLQDLLNPHLRQSGTALPVAARRQEIDAGQLAAIEQAAQHGEHYVAVASPLQLAASGGLGQLLAVAQAGSGVPNYLGTSDEVQFTPAIQALATQLHNNPVAIFNWVHDSIDYVPSYGSIQGADLTLQSRHGNDFDTASLLIALLRAANIPARYVYGSIQVPAAQAQNWFGGVASIDAAQSLLSQGGVPNSALTQGGTPAAIQIEHVWVEAYVGFDPSRGVKNLGGGAWVPLDAGFKPYKQSPGMGLGGINGDAYSLQRTLANSASLNPQTGAISGVGTSAIQSALTAYQNQVNQFIAAHDANATVGEVLGTRSIVPSPADVLPDGLPYHVLSAGAPLDALPDSLRWKLQLALYNTPPDSTQPGLVSTTTSLPALGAQRLTLSFIPASPADQAALQSYLPQPHADGSPIQASEYPSSLPGYLIQVLPQLMVNGQAVSTAPQSAAVEIGTALTLNTALVDPAGGSVDAAPSAAVIAGEYEALAVDGAGIGATQLNNVATRLAATQAALNSKSFSNITSDAVAGDLLYNTALGYFALSDAFAGLYQRAAGVAAARLPSYVRAAVELVPQLQNGVPVKVAFPGVALRADRLIGSAVAQSDAANAGGAAPAVAVEYQQQGLERASAYAHLILQQLYGAAAQNLPAASAVRAIAQSLANNQTVYLLNPSNIASLPQVQVPAPTAADIQNAVAAGLQAIVSQSPVTLGAWQGSGYVLDDPATGAGSYLLVSTNGTAGDAGVLYSSQGMPWLALAQPNQMPLDALSAILGAVQSFDAAQGSLLGGVDTLRWVDLPDSSELITALYGSGFDALSGVPLPLQWATDTVLTTSGTSAPSNLNQGNYPPVFTSTPVTKAYAGRAYRYQASAADPQGLPLHFSVQGPGGVSISATGLVSWAQPAQGSWPILLKVDDGKASAVQAYTLNVGPAPAPLTATLAISPLIADPGAPVVINFTTSGGTGTVHTSLLVNNQPVTLNAAGQVQIAAPGAPGVYSVSGTASDDVSSLNRSGQILVRDSADTTPPTVQITAPVQDGEITAPTFVTGTASDDKTLANYKLALRPVGAPDSAWVVFATGTQAVSAGTLGTFDPSTLQNGLYEIGLFATDQSGNTASTLVGVSVTHDLKIGQFSISFLDLKVDALGVPIQVTRTYDTRRKSEALDFGYGWSVDYQSLVLRKNVATGFNWTAAPSGAAGTQNCLRPQGAHNILITLPDGSLQRFSASNSPECFLGYPEANINIQFNPLPGTTSQLIALNIPQFTLHGNNILDGDGNPWDPVDFQLTTGDGFVYTLKQGYGVVSVKSPYGQVLQYGAGGILHSSDGSTVDQSVPFTRDAANRITSVTDPAGKALQYQYDAAGNLVQVTDRAGKLSKFTYNPDHGLASYTDPTGAVTQNLYDDNGKLIAVIDAQGHRTDLSTNLTSNTQTVTDRRGNQTVYTFDADGNVTQLQDALGHVTTSTFDALGNELTTKDPLGNLTQRTFDPQSGKQTGETDPLNHSRSWSYSLTNTSQLNGQTDFNGNPTAYIYFGFGLGQIDRPLGTGATIGYNTDGSVAKMSAGGIGTSFGYDGQGRTTRQTDALGHSVNYTLDANGNQTGRSWTRTQADGSVRTVTESATYDSNGNALSRTDALGYVSTTQYNGANKPTQETDANGNKTRYQYDASARLTETDYADGSSDKTAYDENGNVIQTTDRAGRVTQTQYDALNRPSQVINADGTAAGTAYDAAGRVQTETDARGHTLTHGYDAAGHLTSDTDALGRVTQYGYDANGNRTSLTGPDHKTTGYAYDAANRLTQTRYPDGSTSSVSYDGASHKLSQTDQSGSVTSYGYDAKGQLTSVQQTLSGNTLTTGYTYDEAGNKTSQTDAQGRVTKWAYDAANHVIGRTLPNGETESYRYDGNGNLASHIDFNGKTTKYAYDSNNRQIAKVLPNGQQVGTSYTPSGQVKTVTDQRGTTSYQYDAADRLTQVQSPSGTLAYAYDANGNRTQLTSPQGTTTYQYDEINRLVAVTGPDGKQTRYAYDAAGNRASQADPNNVLTTYAYDPNNRLTSITHTRTSDSTVLAKYVYTLAANGQRMQVQEFSGASTVPDRQLNYTYDDLKRLMEEKLQTPVGGTLAVTRTTDWTYDSTGNRLTQSVVQGGSTTSTAYTYDSDDRLLTETTSVNSAQTQSVTYAYDPNGNTTSKTVTAGGSTTATVFVYDSDNHLTQVSQGASVSSVTPVVSFQYDANGNRVQASGQDTIAYLVDPNQDYSQIVEESESGPASPASTLYVRGAGDLVSQNRGGAQSFFHGDALRSTRLLTNAAGQVTDNYAYQAFGLADTQNGTTINRHLFAGEYQDPSSGFVNLRARWMNAASGRFLTRDSYQGYEYDPPSLHQYTYANDDPVNRIDPSGRVTLGEVAGAVAIAGDLASLAVGTYQLAEGNYSAAAWTFGGSLIFGVAGFRTAPKFLLWYSNNRAIRLAYNKLVQETPNAIQAARAGGASKRVLAELAVKLRNEAKVIMRKGMDPREVATLEARNMEKYGDPVGPTVDWLLAHGKTLDQIIETAVDTSWAYNLFFFAW